MPLLPADARYYQIAALGTLLAINVAWVDFGATPIVVAATLAGTCTAQALCSRLWRRSRLELPSALITGLSLSLLLRADDWWLNALAGALAIAGKFIIRWRGKHLFNPATFAIVALLSSGAPVWVSPGQWGSTLWLAALVLLLGGLVLQRAARADLAVGFLGSYLLLLVARAWWLGDPWAIPLHQLQSGSLLVFSFFMITDPKTTPDARPARLIFAVLVALLAHRLAFVEQMRPALFFSLFLLAPLVPLLDHWFPSHRFQWEPRPITGVQA